MLLLPPVRFSTTTCWRQTSASRPATRRVTASMPPPAAIGQMTRTTRVGQAAGACANALQETETGTSAVAAPRRISWRRSILRSTIGFDPRGFDDRAPQLGLVLEMRAECL